MIEDFEGDSLAEFAKWIQTVLAHNPEAKVWTYEMTTISADYNDETGRVTTG